MGQINDCLGSEFWVVGSGVGFGKCHTHIGDKVLKTLMEQNFERKKHTSNGNSILKSYAFNMGERAYAYYMYIQEISSLT